MKEQPAERFMSVAMREDLLETIDGRSRLILTLSIVEAHTEWFHSAFLHYVVRQFEDWHGYTGYLYNLSAKTLSTWDLLFACILL